MALRLCLLAVVAIGSWSSGCATCCAPFDDYYPMVGGRWVRDNPTYGRVGSAFDAAGHKVDDVATTTATESAPTQPGTTAEPGATVQPGTTVRPRRDGASYLPTDE